MKIEFNEQEANVLLQCIDLVTKQQGIQFAETGLYLTKKIKDAFEVKQDPSKEIKE